MIENICMFYSKDIKHIIKCPTIQLYTTYVSYMAVVNKRLNETTEVVGEFKHHHTEHRDSSSHWSIFAGGFYCTLSSL